MCCPSTHSLICLVFQALALVGCAIDGGKDSLSMAAKVDDELVKVTFRTIFWSHVEVL